MSAAEWDLFISYAREDRAWVTVLAENLHELGFEVFFDAWEVGPGTVVTLALEEGVKKSRCGVVVVSPAALGRPWVLEEYAAMMGEAVGRGMRIVPVLYEAAEMPAMLAARAWVDFRGKSGEAYFAALRELAAGLRGEAASRRPTPGKGLRAPELSEVRGGAVMRVAVEEPVAVKTYRAWLARREAEVDMIGVAGGEMKLDLSAIYVALRAAPSDACQVMPASDGVREGARRRPGRWAPPSGEVKVDNAGATIQQQVIVQGRASFGAAKERHEEEESATTIDVEAILHGLPSRHALILGHPGSGKTTALQKILFEVRDDAVRMGLAAGTLPVWLPLRRFAGIAGRGIGEWIGDELAIADKDRPLDRALGEELWRYGRLLVLADGLDEVAQESERAHLCAYLDGALLGAKEARAIVSSRYTGYRGDVRLSGRFLPFDLQPLSDDQAEKLVMQWFAAAPGAMPSIGAGEARARGVRLCEALRGPLFVERRRDVMKSTPLLLTLVCVIVNSGREMPESRVAFYEECLKVMLSRWGKVGGRWKEPPFDLTTATAVVQRLAHALHSAGERDDMPRATLIHEAGRRLGELRKDSRRARDAIRWLLEGSGILREFGVGHLGFFHLGMQEYLAAAHIGAVRGASLDAVARALDDSWWHEVSRLMVALPSAGMFEALVSRLLEIDRGWPRHSELIHKWIYESPAARAAPFVAHLRRRPQPAEAEVIAALGILDRFVGDEDVHALAAELAAAGRGEAKLLAKRLVDRHHESTRRRLPATDEALGAGVGVEAGPRARLLALLFREDQRETAMRVASALESQGHALLRGKDGALEEVAALCGERLDAVSDEAAGVVVIADANGAAYSGESAHADALGVWACEGLRIFGAWAGGEAPRWPAELDEDGAVQRWVDVRAGECRELRVQILEVFDRGAVEEVGAVEAIVKGAVFFEPETGIRALGVPGGRFRMGMRGANAAEPVRWVRLSPYWLGETPVTNLQYERFLVANPGHRRPWLWKDERFEGDTRPVIGVTWDDAAAFCAWLSGLPGVKGAGLRAVLPSEAQWEFAARGDDERPYPWGKERPSERLAVFGRKDKGGTTAPVGSCPEGAGPFGHLDLVGNVWEWCRDVWQKRAYELRADEASDPVNEEGDPEWRSLRGDCWYSDELWAAAVRGRRRSGLRRGSDGFRVGFGPASP